jgi:hypothetical protein
MFGVQLVLQGTKLLDMACKQLLRRLPGDAARHE